MTDIDTLVADATAKGTFDVLAAAQGIAYPEDDIVVYTNTVAAYELHKLEDQIADTEDDAAVNALDARKKELREAIKASALTFHMRGISPGYIKALMAQGRAKFPDVEGVEYNQERAEWFENTIIAEHVTQVTNAAGEQDPRKWVADDIAALKDALPDESYQKLLEGTNALSFAAAYFDVAVSEDF